jgi:NitT/TauT family transport system permease protein
VTSQRLLDKRPSARPARDPGPVAVGAVRWGTLLILIVGWALACSGPLAGNGYLVGPVQVVRDGLPAVLTAEPMQQLGYTMGRFAIAFLISAIVGTTAGLAIGRIRREAYLGMRDIVSVLYSMPMAPFYPLFVLWLGLGARSEIAFGVIHGIVPVVLLTMAASADLPPAFLDSSRAMGATRIRRFTSVMLPWLTPQIVGAVKIGAALSLLGVLLAELMISTNGVGAFVASQITNQQAASLDAMVLFVCLGALVVNAALTAAERRTARWRNSLS